MDTITIRWKANGESYDVGTLTSLKVGQEDTGLLMLIQWEAQSTTYSLLPTKQSTLNLFKPLDLTTSLQKVWGTEEQVQRHHQEATAKYRRWKKQGKLLGFFEQINRVKQKEEGVLLYIRNQIDQMQCVYPV